MGSSSEGIVKYLSGRRRRKDEERGKTMGRVMKRPKSGQGAFVG